jgi:hypothetical protein
VRFTCGRNGAHSAAYVGQPENVGTEPASIVAIFSAPGFEDHLRCESVAAGEKPTTISLAEENECDRIGHVVYRDRGEKDPDQ